MSNKEGPQLKKPWKSSKTIELPADDNKYHFELSMGQIFFRSFVVMIALGWMFGFGVLVGRGLPLTGSTEESLRAQFFKFLGLAREPEVPIKNAATTWEKPENMLKALDYHEALTKGTKVKVDIASLPSPDKKPPAAKKETIPDKAEEVAQAVEPEEEAPSEEKIDEEVLPEESAGPYSFLVASLRTPEYADKLVEKLKAKGYSPRVDVVKMAGGKQWHRVILGSFGDNEKAAKFAAQFNQKEKMQGMIIKDSKSPASAQPAEKANERTGDPNRKPPGAPTEP